MKTLANITEGSQKWKANVYVIEFGEEVKFDTDYKGMKKTGLYCLGKVVIKTNSIWPTSQAADRYVEDLARDILIEKGIIDVYNGILTNKPKS